MCKTLFFEWTYYLYEVTSKWNIEKKRSQKVTGKLLGGITEKDEYIESEKERLCKQNALSSLTVKEYGFFYTNNYRENILLLYYF
ncbi:MAG TPA: hypothetical protein PK860_05780 [Paludibacteraceae bacterium]|nr:hypothetical protein [Paludibacteraceae bacterium]HOL01029.1 hypothetical protein [Paludibacteraceae bacterium]HPC25990.1 hypothetical protein [Paludibacteraceae bacterium]HPO67853.1 hypothetical protein [Paludibacteraceae bacterium]